MSNIPKMGHLPTPVVCWYFVRLCGAAGVGCEVSDGQKPSKPIHILTALFTTRIHKENKQILPYQPTSLKTLANTIYCMCLFQHGKQERNIEKLCKNKHGENCTAQVVCWYFVRLCGAAGVGCEVSDGQKPSKPIHILTALFTTRIHKENKQILPYQPTSLKTLANTIYCMCLFQHGKQERNIEKLCKNKHGENCIAQVVCWYFVRLCGAAGVGCEVSDGQKPSKPIHILTALFTTRIHKENKQILPYQPTSLKTLANTILCMCFFQHNGNQNRTHARTSMVKIALRKLFAGILCGCVVLLVLVAKWVTDKNHPNLSIFWLHFSPPEFTKKTNKFYRTNQPYWKLWPTQSTACVSFSIMENRTEPMQEEARWKLHCASCLLVFCAVVWYCLLVTKWAMKKKHPNLSIF